MTVAITVNLDQALASEAKKVAKTDGLSLEELIEATLRRHVEFIGLADEMLICGDALRSDFVLRRDSGESDAEYAERARLLFG